MGAQENESRLRLLTNNSFSQSFTQDKENLIMETCDIASKIPQVPVLPRPRVLQEEDPVLSFQKLSIHEDASRPPKTLYLTAPDTKVPVWLQNYLQNRKQSPLYQLSAELIFLIVTNADRVTRHCMRRACRLFLASIGDGDIRDFEYRQRGGNPNELVPWEGPNTLHFFHGRFLLPRQVWPVHEHPVGINGRRTLLQLLARDRGKRRDCCHGYQQSGRAEEILSRYARRVWCSGCNEKHALILFSATQRRMPDHERICIRREGRIRLCSHEAVSWEDIHRTSRTFEDSQPRFCDNLMWRSCTHQSHHSPEINLWRSLRVIPRVSIFKRLSGPLDISISWSSPVFDLDPNDPDLLITRQDIREHLDSQTTPTLFEHSLCPHVAVNDGQLLLPFEPNQCVCFDQEPVSETSECLGQCHDCGHKSLCIDYTCCRCLAVKSGHAHRQGNFMRIEDPGHQDWETSSNKKMKTTFRTFDPWLISHVLQFTQCLGRYSWNRYGRSVFLSYRNTFTQPTAPTEMSWLDKLDPESWGISADEELRHVVWCPDKDCSTRYRMRALMRALRPHASGRTTTYTYPPSYGMMDVPEAD
ncbi:hypothetical protein V8F33_012494 [Rhypophila sp. PSN 637]